MTRIYQRGKNYYIDYAYQGRRMRKKVGTSRRVAELALNDIEIKIQRDEFKFIARDCPLDTLIDRFIKYSAVNHAPNTQTRYKTVLKNFRIFLESHPNIKKASQVDVGLLEKYKEYRRVSGPTHAKTTTVNIEVRGLKIMMNRAVQWGLINQNPATGVKLLKITDAPRPRFLSENECQLLLSNAQGDNRDAFYILLHTGMRIGELINLEWSDVDFKRRKIAVRRKTDWIPKGTERDIPIADGAYDILYRRSKQLSDSGSTYVFPSNDHADMRRRIKRALVSTAKRSGFPDITKIHTLRHTFASHLVMKGVDLPTVQKLMGHADIKTTMVYSHLSPDHLVEAVNKLDLS
jgi:site-specific recombinase XerD